MTIATVDEFSPDEAGPDRKIGFLRRFWRGIVAARQREAELYVNGYLLGLNGETLASLGQDRAAVARRVHRAGPY